MALGADASTLRTAGDKEKVNHQHLNTIAILGPDTLAEDILVRLLEREGYAVRSLGAYPSGVVEELLDGADLLLLAPGLDSDVRRTFL